MNRTPATDPGPLNTPERVAEFEAALLSPAYAYARAKSWRADGYVEDNRDYTVYAYHRDTASPSGVTLAATLSGLDEASAIMDRHGKPFPLSPTERR